jgi:2-dehydro-3-deoxygalactonokinase
MHLFISCDWGTSSFRLRLVDGANHSVIAAVTSTQGIAEVHRQWQQQAHLEAERLLFYQSVIADQLKQLQKQVTYPVKDIPVIVSGMASSNIGMVELPYTALPFAVDGNDLNYQRIGASEKFPHEMIIISGARTNNDVMRGEEIQLIGCNIQKQEEHLYIFPGTHSKHVTVIHKKAVDFKTYMTGEFFQLLSQHSILSKSIQEDSRLSNDDAVKGFEAGVMQSIHDNLLHAAFLTRTNHLFNYCSPEANYHYLSGLLIGTELKELMKRSIPVTVVANAGMRKYYTTALHQLGNIPFDTIDVDVALVQGHSRMYRMLSDFS